MLCILFLLRQPHTWLEWPSLQEDFNTCNWHLWEAERILACGLYTSWTSSLLRHTNTATKLLRDNSYSPILIRRSRIYVHNYEMCHFNIFTSDTYDKNGTNYTHNDHPPSLTLSRVSTSPKEIHGNHGWPIAVTVTANNNFFWAGATKRGVALTKVMSVSQVPHVTTTFHIFRITCNA
jgi:hypothetical protein